MQVKKIDRTAFKSEVAAPAQALKHVEPTHDSSAPKIDPAFEVCVHVNERMLHV